MSIRVVRPGLLTTVQDTGRPGFQRHGVVVGGAMDSVALRIANLLTGNDDRAAGLEVTLVGPTLEMHDDALIALAGADLGARLDDAGVPLWQPFFARAGSVLSFGAPRHGARCYIAIAGGIDVPVVLGGRGTDLRAHFGGTAGRALASGDTLDIGPATPFAAAVALVLARLSNPAVAAWGAGPALRPHYTAEPVLRVIEGIEHAQFDEASRHAMLHDPFVVSAQSNRMGYRLDGPHLGLTAPHEMISSPVTMGTIQVPPGGAPIVLMADGQTTGGYPRIAQVITHDLPLLAQAPPGTSIRFKRVTPDQAQELYRTRERGLRRFAAALQLRRDGMR